MELRKGATPGYENAPAVMLQGHMDMVCRKSTPVWTYDFTRDPIRLIEDGEYLGRRHHSGADNGIGMAMMLAVLTDGPWSTPPWC